MRDSISCKRCLPYQRSAPAPGTRSRINLRVTVDLTMVYYLRTYLAPDQSWCRLPVVVLASKLSATYSQYFISGVCPRTGWGPLPSTISSRYFETQRHGQVRAMKKEPRWWPGNGQRYVLPWNEAEPMARHQSGLYADWISHLLCHFTEPFICMYNYILFVIICTRIIFTRSIQLNWH